MQKNFLSFLTWKAGFLVHQFKHFKQETRSLVTINCHICWKTLRPQRTCDHAALLPQPPTGEPTAAQGKGNPSHKLPTASQETQSHFSFTQLTRFAPHRMGTKLLLCLLPHESFHPGRLTVPNQGCNINFSRIGGLQQEREVYWCILLSSRLKGNKLHQMETCLLFSTETLSAAFSGARPTSYTISLLSLPLTVCQHACESGD